MVFRWLSISSLTAPKAPTVAGIIKVLTLHNYCTKNLKFWYLEIFSSYFTLMFWYSGTTMLMILDFLFPLSKLQCLAFGVLFLYLFGLQSPKVFHISYSPALALVDVRTISLHIQFPISCIGARVFSPSLSCLFLHWFPARTEHKLTAWVTLLTFSLQSLHREETSWWSMPFFNTFVLSACSWAAHIRLSFFYINLISTPATSFDLASRNNRKSGNNHAMLSLSILSVFHSFVRSFQFNTLFDSKQPSTSLSSWCVQFVSRKALVETCMYIREFPYFLVNLIQLFLIPVHYYSEPLLQFIYWLNLWHSHHSI